MTNPSPYFPPDLREQLQQKIRAGLLDYEIPSYMHGGIEAYLLDGRPPGDFLMNVITNNLREAVRAADDTNIRRLPAYVAFFYNIAPSLSWGQPKALEVWCGLHEQAREKAAALPAGQEPLTEKDRATLDQYLDDKRRAACTRCHGTGKVHGLGPQPTTCPECSGEGKDPHAV